MAEDVHPVRRPPTTEEEARTVTIGALPPLVGRVELADYDRAWPDRFDREAVRIQAGLGDRIRLLEHVGSTSVPGLAAKPIIDILLVLESSADEAAYLPPMEARGFVLRIREPDWHEHRLFKYPDTSVNVHVFPAGSAESSGCCCSATGCPAMPRAAGLRADEARARFPRLDVHPGIRRRQGRDRRRDQGSGAGGAGWASWRARG